MKAIETSYKGYRFRSRLEARWAVFFDALGIKWEYEKEGYELKDDDGTKYHYLPDFWLPGIGWIEIKGQDPTQEELSQCFLLCKDTGSQAYIASQLPPSSKSDNMYFDEVDFVMLGFSPEDITEYGRDFPSVAAFTECRECQKLNFTRRDACGWITPSTCKQDHWFANDVESATSQRIIAAANKARSARFEFGEVPR